MALTRGISKYLCVGLDALKTMVICFYYQFSYTFNYYVLYILWYLVFVKAANVHNAPAYVLLKAPNSTSTPTKCYTF